MRSILIIGWKASESGPVPENLYTGLDGVAAQKAADAARKSNSFIKIGKIVNPSIIPLPIDPAKDEVSEPNKPIERKGFKHPIEEQPKRKTIPPSKKQSQTENEKTTPLPPAAPVDAASGEKPDA